jgi:hypothetical protein
MDIPYAIIYENAKSHNYLQSPKIRSDFWGFCKSIYDLEKEIEKQLFKHLMEENYLGNNNVKIDDFEYFCCWMRHGDFCDNEERKIYLKVKYVDVDECGECKWNEIPEKKIHEIWINIIKKNK